MINFSVHYPYQFDVVNSGELSEGDVTIAFTSGDYAFNVRAVRKGLELLSPGSYIGFVFKTGTTVGSSLPLTCTPSSSGLMPREFFKPFEFGFKYEDIASISSTYPNVIGQSEKDVIEYQKINILNNEASSPSNPRVFSWKGRLYLVGNGSAQSYNGTIPCVNLFRWNDLREGFEKIYVFYTESSSFTPQSCDYVVHNDELFIFFLSDVNYLTCYKATDSMATSWEKVSTKELPLLPEPWTYPNFRYRLRVASDSQAIMVVLMLAWSRVSGSKTYRESEFVQLVSLDDGISFDSAGDSSGFLVESSILGTVHYRQSKNILGLFTVSVSPESPEKITPLNINFDMYYDKNIGSFVIMKCGEGDDVNVEILQPREQKLPNKCYLVGIKNLSGNYFMWESCLKLPLDYNITIPDINSYQNPWSSVFEERIEDVNTIYYNQVTAVGIVIPPHARAMVLTDVCVVPGDGINDLIVTSKNYNYSLGGIFNEGYSDPYGTERLLVKDGETSSYYGVDEKANGVLCTEFCFLNQDAIAPGSYQGKIYSYGGKFHDDISFVCGPLSFETSSIFPKGFRTYGSLNGKTWNNPVGCRWNGKLIASASHSFANNYTFFSVLGPVSNLGEKYGYQHNYCPYIKMNLFGWSENEIGPASNLRFSTPAAWDASRGYQEFELGAATFEEDEETLQASAYCYLQSEMVKRSNLLPDDDVEIENRFSRYRTPLGRVQDRNFKIRLKFSINVDVSGVDIPTVCLAMAKINSRKYSIHLVKVGSGATDPRRIVFKYETSGGEESKAVNLADLNIASSDYGNLDSYIEVLFGNGPTESGTQTKFLWCRANGGNWTKGVVGAPTTTSSVSFPELEPDELTNGLWVGLLSVSSISSLSDGDKMQMRVRQVAVSSYGHQYRPAYSNSFRRPKTEAEGPSAEGHYFEPIRSYSPYISLPDGSELLLESRASNPPTDLFNVSSYQVKRSRARNSPDNVTNNISDSIYDFTAQYEVDPSFEIIFKSKDGLPVDCLTLINMVGFYSFDLSCGDYNEETGAWSNKVTESYTVPYTRHSVESSEGKTILLDADINYEYQRDQLVGHSVFVFELNSGAITSVTNHRLIISNFDRIIVLDRPIEIAENQSIVIVKRNGSFDVPASIGAAHKNYFSLSFSSTDDVSLRAIGEVILGKWIDLSDFHLTASREKVKEFETSTSSMGLLFSGSTQENSGVKDSISINFTKLQRGTGDADYCMTLFSDVYMLEKNFPILFDYDGKASTEYVSFADTISYVPDEYDRAITLKLMSQSPKSIPRSNSILSNEVKFLNIEAYVGGDTVGFQNSTGSFNLRAAPLNFDGTGIQYVWNDGNRNIIEGGEVVISYSQFGSYNVQLKAYKDGRQVALASQTLYYVDQTISYYEVEFEEIGSSHQLTITGKAEDGSTVLDSTTRVFVERSRFGFGGTLETTAVAEGTLLEGVLVVAIPETTSVISYDVSDLNGIFKSVSLLGIGPIGPIIIP
jgi:hypothetical protein